MLSNEIIIIRLLMATVIGGAIGFEREYTNRPAGFRTHILVTLGSTLIMLISLHSFGMERDGGDPGRIAAQVVSGIGFLGAGSIIQSRGNVKGLTTAASIWVCGGLGLAIGSGMYFAAVVAAVITLVSLFFNDRIMSSIYGKTLGQERYPKLKNAKLPMSKFQTKTMKISFDGQQNTIDELEEIFQDFDYKIFEGNKFTDEYGKELNELTIDLTETETSKLDSTTIQGLSKKLMQNDGVKSFKL